MLGKEVLVADSHNRLEELISAHLNQLEEVEIQRTSGDKERSIGIGQAHKYVTIRFPSSYKAPSQLDVLLLDKRSGKCYGIYITEVNDDALDAIARDILSITVSYLNGAYTVVTQKGFLSSSERIEFDNPGIIYRTAVVVRSRRF